MSGVRVSVGSNDEAPAAVEAIAYEDDTYGVLAADPRFREPDEHPIRIWTRVHEMTPAEPGSVRVGKGDPLKLLATVHDLSEDPTWREEWIARALSEILEEVARRGIRTLGLQLLGCIHGRFPPESFLDLLESALGRNRPETLHRLWLIAPADRAEELIDLIAQLTRES